MKAKKIEINKKLDLIKDYWNPHIVAELNGQQVKLARFQGSFEFHSHQNEDELFFVLSGTLFIETPQETLSAKPGEMILIPKGLIHKPFTKDNQEVEAMLFEPSGTLNTGNKKSHFTIKNPKNI